MSRIRSIHPGLWTDEAFMSLSAHARLLSIGLWTEAFDDGVFEWKPLTLKARIFPADSVDVPALLAELVRADCIAERDGPKPHGLIRNFRQYQRPKKPNSSGLLSVEDRSYVGMVPDQSPAGTEKPPQMEDGGGRMEEEDEEKPPPHSEPGAGAIDLFDEIWETFPRNPRSSREAARRAFKAFGSAEQGGVLPAAQRYAKWFPEDCVRRKRSEVDGIDFVPKLSTWLSNGSWREAVNLSIKGESTGPVVAMIRVDQVIDPELFAECGRVRDKPTPNSPWSFAVDVVEAARSNLKAKAAA